MMKGYIGRMKKKIIFIITVGMLSTNLLAYSDTDMDGVFDDVDRCPNTPFSDLVDINGCTKKRLSALERKKSDSRADVIIGVNYSGSNYASLNQTDTLSSSLQVDYYHKDLSLQIATSYYTTDGDGYSESGMNDTFIGASYTLHPLKTLLLRFGIGMVLPTYETSLNNNNTDYTASVNMSYAMGKINIFGGYSYRMINDDDVSVTDSSGNVYNYLYQNTNAYSLGLGYYLTQKLYVSTAYNRSESIYVGSEDIESISLYAYKSIDTNYFVTFSYAYGMSDSASDHALSVKVGYYF